MRLRRRTHRRAAQVGGARVTPGTIPELVETAAVAYADTEAVVDHGDDGVVRRVTFAELARLVRRAATGCAERGVQPGDRVAVWGPNSLEWVVAALGALAAGAAIVPLNTRFKAEEAAYILDKSGAVLTFVSPPFLGNDYPAMLGGRPSVLLDENVWTAYDEKPATAVRPDDTGDIIFTSGTTGRPKGVVTTHAQTLRVFETWADVVGLRAADRYLVVNPFFHTFGYKAGIVACLLRGATSSPADLDLMKQIAQLPAGQRAAIVLHYLEDRPVAEVADVLQCSVATAKVHLHRGRKRLAVLLDVEDVR